MLETLSRYKYNNKGSYVGYKKSFLAVVIIFSLIFLSLEAKAYNIDLYKQIRAGNIIEVKKLISTGMDVNQEDYKGMTPLMRAASFGHTEIVKLLIDNNAAINVKDKAGNTPLKHAAWSDDVEIVNILIEKGAGLEVKNKLGTTPIWSAVITGRLNMVSNLLKHGANPNVPNQYGMSAIRFSKTRDEWDVVKLLQEVGAKEF